MIRDAKMGKPKRNLSAINNQCDGLRGSGMDLLWRTAPPRMTTTDLGHQSPPSSDEASFLVQAVLTGKRGLN